MVHLTEQEQALRIIPAGAKILDRFGIILFHAAPVIIHFASDCGHIDARIPDGAEHGTSQVLICLCIILLHAVALIIHLAEIGGNMGVAEFGGFAEKPESAFGVTHHAFALIIELSEADNGIHILFVHAFQQPTHRNVIIARDRFSLAVKQAQTVHRFHIAVFRGKANPFQSFRPFAGSQIQLPDFQHHFRIAVFRRRQEQFQSLRPFLPRQRC